MAKRKLDPRKLLRGTAYTAKGAIAPEKGFEQEQGSSLQSALREVVPELGTPSQAALTYKKMARNATVRASLRAARTGVLGADYFVEPYDDTPDSRLIAEFVEYNLFTGMNRPFKKVLADVLKMYEYGVSVFESVYETREWAAKQTGANRRKYTMLRKLAYRPRSTIAKFVYDDAGGPVSIVQNAVRADGKVQEVTIPVEKLIIFTFDEDGSAEGESLLRSAYEHWFYKTHLYKVDAIQKERHAIGIPDIELGIGADSADWAAARILGKNLRTNEQAHVVRTASMKVGFLKVEGELVDVMKSIEHHDGQIMLNVMAQFLLLGLEGQGGGRATSGAQLDMFSKSLRYIAELICAAFNMYLIPRLVAYNFDTVNFPALNVRNIGESKDLQLWAAAIANLIAKGALTVDDPTEAWIRKVFDIPVLQIPRPDITLHSQKGGGGAGRPETTGNVGKADAEA